MKSVWWEKLAITLQSWHKMFINDNDVSADCEGSAELGEHSDV